MRHDWIFDVLTDLRNYAEKNGLTAIANEAERALIVARKELAEVTAAEQKANAPAQSDSKKPSS
jgi:hypothetical protein